MADRFTNSFKSPGPKSRKRSRQPSSEEAATTAADAVNPPTQGRIDEASSLLQDAGCSRQPKCRRLAPSTEEENISVLPASSLRPSSSGSFLKAPLSSVCSCSFSSSSCPFSSFSCPSSSSSCLAPILEEDDDFVVSCTSARQQSLPLNRKRGLKRRMKSARTSTAADAVNPPTQGRKDEASSLLQDTGDHQSHSRQPQRRCLAPSTGAQAIRVFPASSPGSFLKAPLSTASSCPSSSSSCPSSSSSCPSSSSSCLSSSFSCPSSSSSCLAPILEEDDDFVVSCTSARQQSLPFNRKRGLKRRMKSARTSTVEPEIIIISSDDDDDESESSAIREQLNTQQASLDFSPRGLPPIDLQNEIPEPPDRRDLPDPREPNEVWPRPPINPIMLSVETGHFPTKIFKSATHNHQTECCICTEEYIEGEELRVLPCFHTYHVNCIDAWLKVKKICPFCRMQLY